MSEESILDDSLKKVARGGGIVFIGIFVGQLLFYLSRVLIARWVGESSYGQISLAISILGIGTVLASAGIQGGIKRYIPFYTGKEDKRRVKGTILSGIQIVIPLSLIIGPILYFSSAWLATEVFGNAELIPLIKIFSIGVPIYATMQLLMSIVQGFQKMEYRSLCKYVIEPITRFTFVALFLSLGLGVFGASLGYILAIAVTAVFTMVIIEERIFSVIESKINGIKITRKLFLYSWPLLLAGIIGLVTSWTDTLMLGAFKSLEDVGLYNAARPTVEALRAVPMALGMIFLPVMAELYGMEKEGVMKNLYKSVDKWLFFILLPFLLLGVLYAPVGMRIVFGGGYVAASSALAILLVGYFTYSIFQPSRGFLKAIGRTKFFTIISGITAVTNFVLNFVLIPVYGINGAAIATSISIGLGGISGGILAYLEIGFFPIGLEHIKSVIASPLALLISYIFYRTITSFFEVSTLILILTLASFIFLYTLFLLVLKSFDRNDIIIMRAIEKKSGVELKVFRKILKKFL